MSHAETFLKAYQAAADEIAQQIEQVASLLASRFAPDDPLKKEVVRFVAEGGKRFRPALSLIVARSFGKNDVFPHLALEAFHKYLLVHDDIIDRDDMRYGAPTTHAKLRRLHANNDQHFGNSLAIIGGDLIAAAATHIILKADLTPKTKIDLQKLLLQAHEDVAWGWYDQFLMDYLPLDSPDLSFERIEKSIIWVTGRYSLLLSFLYGYTIGGQKAPAGLDTLADSMGALFQTGDDLIGLFGDTKRTGKSNYGDISQGKKTLPMWFSYQLATAADKKTLCRLVGKSTISEAEVAEVRSIIKRSGAYEHSQKLMQQYRKKCLGQLEKIAFPADLKDFLQGFIYYLETRDH